MTEIYKRMHSIEKVARENFSPSLAKLQATQNCLVLDSEWKKGGNT